MSKFMPVSQEAVTALEESVSKTIFESVERFVEFYNSGIISKNNDQVKEISREITEAYKDVKLKGNSLTFISEEEVVLDETLHLLAAWEVLTKVKREAADAVDAKSLKNDSTIVLTKEGNFNLYNSEDHTTVSTSIEKINPREESFAKLLSFSSYGTDYDESYGGYVFSVSDLLNINTNFILELKAIVPSA